MKAFPDESTMERSQDGTEPIRGGSIGLNRILGRFVTRASKDTRPEFTAVLMSAFNVFRNVWTMDKNASLQTIEQGVINDINLFLDYYDTYLDFTINKSLIDKRCPVVVYFPTYDHVASAIRRPLSGNNADLFDKYKQFLNRYSGKDEMARKLSHCQCFFIRAGHSTYPHRDVARKFKEIAVHPSIYYSPGDTIALMTNAVLDYHIAGRLKSVSVLESYTGELKSSDTFKYRLDSEGRVPFNSVMHLAFGDNLLIKPFVTPKEKKLILEQAVKERWLSRGEADLMTKVAKIKNIPVSDIRKYDFL